MLLASVITLVGRVWFGFPTVALLMAFRKRKKKEELYSFAGVFFMSAEECEAGKTVVCDVILPVT